MPNKCWAIINASSCAAGVTCVRGERLWIRASMARYRRRATQSDFVWTMLKIRQPSIQEQSLKLGTERNRIDSIAVEPTSIWRIINIDISINMTISQHHSKDNQQKRWIVWSEQSTKHTQLANQWFLTSSSPAGSHEWDTCLVYQSAVNEWYT